MNACGERGGIAAVVVGLNSIRAGARRGVKVDRNEGAATLSIRDRDPLAERDEVVAAARHDYAIAVLAQDRSETLRDVEREIFFANLLIRNAAAIKAAVAGVDHN